MKWTFEIHDAIIYKNEYIGRIEDRAISSKGEEIYLIQLSNHHCHWALKNEIEQYIG